ncbi:MAG TPA: NUDIX domain-containing protein [Verrucomicrobiae bacterium]|nr:NUDIX domain-containing protein [Verrucomicrobiae bacterium]
MPEKLHKTQLSILRTLRRNPTARFTELMLPTGQESDTFKFHVRKLAQIGYIQKLPNGLYSLTVQGKEFANNLNEQKRATQKQPKLSVVLIVAKPGQAGEPLYLFQKRLRQPYYGYWGHMSGPVQWGEDLPETARRELRKQTGLTASFTVRAFHRSMDYSQEEESLLEDKLFGILQAAEISGELSDAWSGGHNQWMTVAELVQQPDYFAPTLKFIELAQVGESYTSEQLHYKANEY